MLSLREGKQSITIIIIVTTITTASKVTTTHNTVKGTSQAFNRLNRALFFSLPREGKRIKFKHSLFHQLGLARESHYRLLTD